MTKTRRFVTVGDAPTFTMTMADICNGLDCVSSRQFPIEAVIEMAGHIVGSHGSDESWDKAAMLMAVEEVDVDEPVTSGRPN